MLKLMKIILVVVGVLVIAVLGVLGVAATRPDQFRVERTVLINAPAEKIFPILEDLRQQRNWSPWDQVDPSMKRSYTGAERGIGQVYDWDGKDIGQGRQEITGVTPNSKIDIKIDFFRPFEAHNRVELVLRPARNGTNVTWAIFGPVSVIHRAMHMFMSIERMIGGEFEKGLLQLKALAEK